MSDQNKFTLLTSLCSDSSAGSQVRMGYSVLSKNTGLSKSEIEGLLTELNKERYISQFAKKGVDAFTATVNQKAFDVIEDGSL